jgi:hypothetical protein
MNIRPSLLDTFSWLVEEQKSAQREVFLSGRRLVGAAWSAYQMVTDEPAHGAETCPFSAITCPFSSLPKKCPGESVADPLSPVDDMIYQSKPLAPQTLPLALDATLPSHRLCWSQWDEHPPLR